MSPSTCALVIAARTINKKNRPVIITNVAAHSVSPQMAMANMVIPTQVQYAAMMTLASLSLSIQDPTPFCRYLKAPIAWILQQ